VSGKANVLMLFTVSLLLCGCAVPRQASLALFAPPGRPELAEEHRTAFNRALEMVMRGEYAPAAEEFRRLEKLFAEAGATRQTAEVIFWAGYCEEKLGNTEQAVQLYRRCYEIDRESPSARQAVRRTARVVQSARGAATEETSE